MHAVTVLQNRLRQFIPELHKKRLSVLMAAVDSALRGRRLTLSELARGLESDTSVRHRVKRVDRLPGNGWLGEHRFLFYRAPCRLRVVECDEPVILVD